MGRVKSLVLNHKGTLWVVGALLAGGAYAYQVNDEHNRASCQAQYNTAFAEQAKIRSKISAASDAAQTDLIAGVGKLILAPPSTNPEVLKKRGATYRSLFVEFNRVVDQVEKDRAATPLPETPNC